MRLLIAVVLFGIAVQQGLKFNKLRPSMTDAHGRPLYHFAAMLVCIFAATEALQWSHIP